MGDAIVLARDLMMRARLEGAARAAGYTVVASDGVAAAIALVDLDAEGALDQVRALQARTPAPRVVGFISHVDRARWDEAVSLGVEVHPRGASTRAAAILTA